MKKRFLSVILVIGCLFATSTFCGCGNDLADPWGLKREEQGFYYYVIGDNGKPQDKHNKGTSAVILGLKDEISQADELVIPKELGGYPVSKIGEVWAQYLTPENYYGLNVSKISCIIINHEISLCSCGLQWFKGDLIINAEIKCYDNVDYHYYGGTFDNVNYVEINSDYDFLNYLNDNEMSNHNYCVFKSNGGQQKTYAEAVQKNSLLKKPEEPTKEGHTFEGWFTNDKYETQWNFEEDLVTENMTLYAKWQEILS